MSFFTGTKGKWETRPWAPGAQEAYGAAGDYYKDLLSNDSETFNQFQAPELRRFREQTIPDISEQFAGMGSGGLSSSGFRNAAVGAGADLSERLGAIRAQLRQQGAQGLQSLGQQYQNQQYYKEGQPGLLDSIGPAIGGALGSFLGPLGTAAGSALGGAASSWLSSSGGGVKNQQRQNYNYGSVPGVTQNQNQGYNPLSFGMR